MEFSVPWRARLSAPGTSRPPWQARSLRMRHLPASNGRYRHSPAGHQMDQNPFNPVVPTVNTDLAILTTPALATRFETLIRVFREIGVRSDPEELFATLANELHRVLPFDCVGPALTTFERIRRSFRSVVQVRTKGGLRLYSRRRLHLSPSTAWPR
jgi:hypothetical protein